MVYRSFNAPDLEKTMEPFLPLEGFYPMEWIRDERNIALTDGRGSFALFEYSRTGIYYGHYFFKVRGREACRFAKKCLHEAFERQGVEIIVGLTPCDNKPALWMNRYLGFKYQDTLDTRQGLTQMFMLTKKEWEHKNG